ncbi:lactococcin 972 family bacteriocin [Enterococcus faecalis]|uniref:lactococcin 972 family bacteriocin n=1 Tax=Enterococcus faecalis TaxID=1351 RepID=UPI002DBDA80F|nr:lactococcin 972 family bacteriocin [Enterococcus faecalis]MEB7954638.1 lactococcin 972 family bacteriocin [Enterococcus faecalis]MEB7964808.1 lactococcin 972 family bacteriocin [Enterococcus faecalis]
MKKFVLALAVLGFSVVTIDKVALADDEPTSGGLTAEQLESQGGNIQTYTTKSVGGGTWVYMSNLNGYTTSDYYHRAQKHSSTVKKTNGVYYKSTRPAGQWSRAKLKYVSGQNSVYWDNAATGSIGDVQGADF